MKKEEILIGTALLLVAIGVGLWTFAGSGASNGQPVVACTMDAKICPDGTAVGRTGPNCEFAACPTGGAGSSATGSTTASGKFCGGIAAFPCPSGFTCKLDGTFPDAGGHCVSTGPTGVLIGHVTIGPNCPVERAGSPCPTPPEAYTSRTVVIYDRGTSIMVASAHFNPDGSYFFRLPVGTYIVNIPSTGVGGSKDLPKFVTLVQNGTTTLDFSIDTGIR